MQIEVKKLSKIMKNIKNYETFINENNSKDFTILYLEGMIDYNEWEQEFDKLNEGKIVDYIKTKIVPVLQNLVKKIKTAGQKALNVIKKIFNTIKSFANKNPRLFKIIVLMLVLLIIGVVTASAATVSGGDPSDIHLNITNAAIGLLENITNSDNNLDISFQNLHGVMDAKAYLIDLRDGTIDDPVKISEHAKWIVENAYEKVGELIEEEDAKNLDTLKTIGENVVEYVRTATELIIKKSNGVQSITL